MQTGHAYSNILSLRGQGSGLLNIPTHGIQNNLPLLRILSAVKTKKSKPKIQFTTLLNLGELLLYS